jgi:hypothetical protein
MCATSALRRSERSRSYRCRTLNRKSRFSHWAKRASSSSRGTDAFGKVGERPGLRAKDGIERLVEKRLLLERIEKAKSIRLQLRQSQTLREPVRRGDLEADPAVATERQPTQ